MRRMNGRKGKKKEEKERGTRGKQPCSGCVTDSTGVFAGSSSDDRAANINESEMHGDGPGSGSRRVDSEGG